MSIVVSVERPVAPDVVALLEQHLAFAREVTPEGGVFALDLEALSQPAVTSFCAREDGRLLVEHILEVAKGRGYHRLSLETGNFPAFAPARALYATSGFAPCAPYGDYVDSSASACMTIAMGG